MNYDHEPDTPIWVYVLLIVFFSLIVGRCDYDAAVVTDQIRMEGASNGR